MNQELLDRILQSPRLPSLPAIALEVIELVQQADISIKEIADTIQYDPALSTKILKTVNSSFYAQTQSVSTISHALVVLGLKSVKTLALGFSLVGNLQDTGGEGFDQITFWKRSLYAATAAKSLARQKGGAEQEEAFLGGLLQDLGMLAMMQTLGREYAEVVEQAEGDHRKLWPCERKALQTDHCEVGAALADKWKLPSQLIAPIRFHERPDQAPPDVQTMVRSVALGNVVAEVFIQEKTSGFALDEYYKGATQWFGLSQSEAEPLLKEIHNQTKEMRRLFDLPTGGLGNPDEILAQANDALLNISLQTQQQSTQLEQQNKELSDQAYTDSLTGVANRRRFNEFLAEQFDAAQNGAGPLSVLFLDADKFKNFNDTYGHATGDRVLVALGACLTEVMPDASLPARYGGEEFAVILPDTDRRAATILAEQGRQKIAQMTVQSDEGEDLHITASIGVATQEDGFFASADLLVKAADQGVYAAKSSGRNCVRVFTPRAKKDAA